mmetsp:Transcript_28821/g.61698  ORF Transcript_28821/g.61698 Transcript_28821/m.61698 type:complete len:92 (+) Transcript_28821:2-277(+)
MQKCSKTEMNHANINENEQNSHTISPGSRYMAPNCKMGANSSFLQTSHSPLVPGKRHSHKIFGSNPVENNNMKSFPPSPAPLPPDGNLSGK